MTELLSLTLKRQLSGSWSHKNSAKTRAVLTLILAYSDQKALFSCLFFLQNSRFQEANDCLYPILVLNLSFKRFIFQIFHKDLMLRLSLWTLIQNTCFNRIFARNEFWEKTTHGASNRPVQSEIEIYIKSTAFSEICQNFKSLLFLNSQNIQKLPWQLQGFAFRRSFKWFSSSDCPS